MAPILNKLAFEHGHKINFTIQCGAPQKLLQSIFLFDFQHIPKSDDIGMLMSNSLDVQPQQSHRAYKNFHEHWAKEAVLKSRAIDRQKADAVVSNVSYLSLAAAKQLKRPHLGLCSLNWADIYYSYCKSLPGSGIIYKKALQHYQEADRFLIPTPGMPMQALDNSSSIGPLARLGIRHPSFRQQLGLNDNTQLVMVSMGGIPYKMDQQQWPQMENVVWLDTSPNPSARPDVLSVNQIPYDFIDVLCNCDLLICKPGYGLFAEATCNGIPVLYVKREQWPEEPYLVNWLHQHNLAMQLNRNAFQQGLFAEDVTNILDMATTQNKAIPPAPTGVGEACGHILELLALR